jgi:hypothetical protein
MSVDELMDRNRAEAIEENTKVMQYALDSVKYLATEMIALRCKEVSSGKFINLFRTIAKRDPSAAAYLNMVEESRRSKKNIAVNLISTQNVKLVVKTIKQMIVEKMLSRIKEQRKVCLILNGTQDVSKKAANVLLVRYLESEESGILHPVERLLEVFTCGETSDARLKDEVTNVLNKLEFDM